MAFTKIEIQRLLSGKDEPISSGFGSANIWTQARKVKLTVLF